MITPDATSPPTTALPTFLDRRREKKALATYAALRGLGYTIHQISTMDRATGERLAARRIKATATT